MSKTKNLQPWIDYFRMLQRHEREGFLQMKPGDHEAYVTQPALLVLAGTDETKMRHGATLRDGLRMMRRCTALLRRLRVYAACMNAHAKGLSTFDPAVADISTRPLMEYLRQPFALNVVQPDEPHDPLFTMLIETRRPWWRLWMPHDRIEVIGYQEDGV